MQQLMPFAKAIEEWYGEYRRDLPWRNTTDPYEIWVSEIILQQTRVAQGYDYYVRFLRAFPSVDVLASAPEEEVMRLWQGLGYYSRARNLHAAAQQIVQQGAFPSTYKEILGLKGVGPYTAAAIASFAFGEPCAVVDGNVYRILSRYFGMDTPQDSTEGKHLFAALAQEMLDVERPALYNQAIMDFGALQCVPQSPDCSVCPLAETCVAFRENRVEQLPVKGKTLEKRTRYFSYIYIRCKGKIAVRRRDERDIWRGLFEVPCLESAEGPVAVEGVPCVLLAQGVKHVLSHQILMSDFYLLDLPDSWSTMMSYACFAEGEKDDGGDATLLFDDKSYRWIPEQDRESYAFPKLLLKLFERI